MFIKEGAMHIYYATKGLRGRPYHSDVINTDLFAFFQGKRSRTIPSAETLRLVNAFPQCDIDMGEDTDSEYVCEKGTFYIPTSICMGEVVNAGWAVDYYFVVLCGDAVELRYVRWDCPWYETVGRDTEVTDPAVIAKMERTLAMHPGCEQAQDTGACAHIAPGPAHVLYLARCCRCRSAGGQDPRRRHDTGTVCRAL